MTPTTQQDAAEKALALLERRGFDHAQASVVRTDLTELNISNSQPSLLRSGSRLKLTLTGITGARRAMLEWPGADGLDEAVDALWTDAQAAPVDEAHSVSAGQRGRIEQGPAEPDIDLLTAKTRELLEFRARHTPAFSMKEGVAAHHLQQGVTLSSGGSELHTRIGWQALEAFGSAREGTRSASFNAAGGTAHDLSAQRADEWFGIGEMMRSSLLQLDPRPIGERFAGDIVLTPSAVESLLQWLLGQIGDERLIARQSLYAERVGDLIASPLLTLQSRFDAPGVAAVSVDGYLAPPVQPLAAGRLQALIPSAYGARRTGIPHRPTAPAGWEMLPGLTPRAELAAGIRRGAWVDRLSMGMPSANGDFAGVIKNSFVIEDGRIGHALKESMVAGNMARMLHDVVAVSAETLDCGGTRLPWVRIAGLHYS